VNTAEIIEQIKRLPPSEHARVIEFLSTMAVPVGLPTRSIRCASKEVVRAAGEKVLTQHSELFEKLAECKRQELSGNS